MGLCVIPPEEGREMIVSLMASQGQGVVTLTLAEGGLGRSDNMAKTRPDVMWDFCKGFSGRIKHT